ncbi:MAG: hypothetical protein ACLQM8_13660 [Limisphaerales bacterium]
MSIRKGKRPAPHESGAASGQAPTQSGKPVAPNVTTANPHLWVKPKEGTQRRRLWEVFVANLGKELEMPFLARACGSFPVHSVINSLVHEYRLVVRNRTEHTEDGDVLSYYTCFGLSVDPPDASGASGGKDAPAEGGPESAEP